MESEPVHHRRILLHTVKKLDSKGPGTAPAILESLPAFNGHVSDITSSPNASSLDVIAVRAKSSLKTRNNTPPHSLADTTDLYLPIDNDDVDALFQNLNYEVGLSGGMHHFSLHPFI